MDTQPQYEFSDEQNKVIGELSSSMRFLGNLMIFVGCVYIILIATTILQIVQNSGDYGSIVVAVLLAVTAFFFLLTGNWTKSGSLSFDKVVKTTGQDITNLMDALGNLRKLYVFHCTIAKIYIICVIIFVCCITIIQTLGRSRI